MTQEVTKAEGNAPPQAGPLRTDPKSFVVQGIAGLRSAVLPIAAVYFSMRGTGSLAIIIAIFAGLAFVGLGAGTAYLRWRKFTYQVNSEDIRVESGIISRTARSVPFERIQDVSLEQSLIPRLFGLVSVKFETGSGGGEDISLQFLAEAEGEKLRELVRARKDGVVETDALVEASTVGEVVLDTANHEQAETLFAMDGRRLFTFGMFEFSLAVFAVLAGLAQYAEWFVDYEIWDVDLWREVASEQQGWLAGLGQLGQAFGALFGLIGLFVVGSATGLVRTYLRDWGFILEQTARGFRRRRGLLTKTDVVMPAHRVQAINIGTGILRYRFGWHSLNFVSLAQDSGSSNHIVAPFAKMDEIEPVIEAAGFHAPSESLDWHRASKRSRFDSLVLESGIVALAAIPVAIFAPAIFALIPLAIAAVLAFANYYSWRFFRHATDHDQLFSSRGLFSPSTQIASQVKLHSAEVSQGPIAQRRGYATLHLGLAGGTFSIPGIPTQRAHFVRQAVIENIAATDFSQLSNDTDRS
ncbi:MAG: PH domain-containing protein [Erythrobacter sp.]